MYPDWFLIVNMTIGIIGFYISVLLFRNKLKMKFFLIIVIVLFLVGFILHFSLLDFEGPREVLEGKKAGEEFCDCLQSATDNTKRVECATAIEEKYGEKLLYYGNFCYGFQMAFESCQHLYFVEDE